jgi:hypothetical protein
MEPKIQVGDWVRCKAGGPIGVVKRVASDGAWADVTWPSCIKRMKTEKLIIQTSIATADGMTVRDVTREKELEG